MLTRKEKEIFNLIINGKNNEEIAQELFSSRHTIKNHVTHILEKCGCRDKTELVVKHDKGELN